MLGRQLHVDARGGSGRVTVFDSEVWERDLPVYNAQVVMLGGLPFKRCEALIVSRFLPAQS